MLGDLIKSQKLQKYPFRKSKGLFSREFILVSNLLADVLVKKSVALCQCTIRKSWNEWTLPNKYFIEVSRWVPLKNAVDGRSILTVGRVVILPIASLIWQKMFSTRSLFTNIDLMMQPGSS